KTTPVTDHPQMISPDTKVLLVSACWGSGSNTTREMVSRFRIVRSGERTIDDYSQAFFQAMLKMAIDRTFLAYPNLECIVVCDRAPVERGLELENTITSHRPLSGVFHRHTSSGSV
ncbi:hypothetical protein KC640_03695, partial [Candidatus Dojkabacteria bacterium]|nr:hypothetical protein [Candidatus Dojkabacteria bacterium]